MKWGGNNVFLSVFLFIHTISPKVFNEFQRHFMEKWAKEKLIQFLVSTNFQLRTISYIKIVQNKCLNPNL